MPISFNEVPNAVRNPFVYVEFDGSQAFSGPSIMPYKGVVFGQKLSSGIAEPNKLILVTSANKAGELFGKGSLLHRQFISWFKGNNITPAYAYVMDDPTGSNKSEGSITVDGTADKAGTLSVYICGVRVQIGVSSGASLSDIATATVTAINNKSELPVTAAVNGSVDTQVDLIAKFGGLVGDEITISMNVNGEETPGSLTVTITNMSGGSGAPDFGAVWANLGDEHYNVWANPYTDSASLASIEARLGDLNEPTIQRDAVAFGAKSGTVGDTQTFGNSRNSKWVSVISTQQSVTPAFEYGASYAATAAKYLQIDPARPLQTLELEGVIAPSVSKRYTMQERNILLFDGIATSYVDAGGKVRIERAITMYQENELGADDIAFLDVNTIYTLSYLRYDFRTYFLTKYPRHKLANDGTRFGAGQAVITPKTAKAEAVSRFREWERIGLVEDVNQFKNDMIVERNVSDPNRLDFMLPTNLINQLRVIGAQFKFLLN